MATKKTTTKTPTASKKAPSKKASTRSTKATTTTSKAAKAPARSSRAPAKKTAKRAETSVESLLRETGPTQPKPRAESPGKRVALAVAEAALDKKAVNVQILDVTGKVDYADFLVVMSGRSDRQVNAIARGVAEDVQKKTGNRCTGIEGLNGGAWVLLDFGDVVVHVFHDDVRGYYDLESLWIDAARLPVPGQPG